MAASASRRSQRRCTDILCLLIFLAFWGGIIFLAYLSATVGDPYEVLYGADYLGNRCGVGAMKDKKYVYFPRADKDIIAQAAIASTMPWRVRFYGLCLERCPPVASPTACMDDPSTCSVVDYGTPAQYNAAGGSASYFAVMPSIPVMHRCIPRDSSDMYQDDDRCAFPQCDGVNYAPCDTEFNKTWVLTNNYPRSKLCQIKFRRGEVQQLKPLADDTLSRNIGAKVNTWARYVEAVVEGAQEVGIFGCLVPIGMCFAWLVLLRLFAATIIYVSLILLGLGLAFFSIYCFALAGAFTELFTRAQASSLNVTTNMSSAEAYAADAAMSALGLAASAQSSMVALAPSELDTTLKDANSDPTIWYGIGGVSSIVFIIYVIMMCLSRKRIKTCVALVKSSTEVLKDRPLMMFFPFGSIFVQCLFLVFFMFVIACLFTANLDSSHFMGGLSGVTQSASFLDAITWYNQTLEKSGAAGIANVDSSATMVQTIVYLYLAFSFLWTINLVINVSWTAMSGSVCHWFFFRGNDQYKTKIPLLRSLGRVLFYHLGSIAFGSFIVAAIQLVRIILMLIDKYTKDLQKKNPLFLVIIKCTQCCLWCLEKTIKYITGYAYIYVALQGSSFCGACFSTFSLLFANPAQMAINGLVRVILYYVQVLTVPLISAWIGNIALIGNNRPDPMYATVVIGILALIFSSLFATVFGCVLDTLFVCCCRDRADYSGKHMPDRLKEAYGFDKNAGKGDDDAEKKEALVGKP